MWQITNTIEEQLKEHPEEPKALIWSPNSPDSNTNRGPSLQDWLDPIQISQGRVPQSTLRGPLLNVTINKDKGLVTEEEILRNRVKYFWK